MAYNIQYSLHYREKYPPKKGNTRILKKILAGLLLFSATVLLYKLHQEGILREFLIPGDADITVAAMEALANDLKYGIPFKDAVTAFCIEILEHGNVF